MREKRLFEVDRSTEVVIKSVQVFSGFNCHADSGFQKMLFHRATSVAVQSTSRWLTEVDIWLKKKKRNSGDFESALTWHVNISQSHKKQGKKHCFKKS